MSMSNDFIRYIKKIIRRKKGFSLDSSRDCIHAAGIASDALLYSMLFMPELNLVCDSVLLSWCNPSVNFESNFKDRRYAKHYTEIQLQELEASFNFIEVGYLFDCNGRDTTDEEDEVLAIQLRTAWDAWLKYSYPDRKFCVEVLTPEETGSTVGVHFFEIR